MSLPSRLTTKWINPHNRSELFSQLTPGFLHLKMQCCSTIVGDSRTNSWTERDRRPRLIPPEGLRGASRPLQPVFPDQRFFWRLAVPFAQLYFTGIKRILSTPSGQSNPPPNFPPSPLLQHGYELVRRPIGIRMVPARTFPTKSQGTDRVHDEGRSWLGASLPGLFSPVCDVIWVFVKSRTVWLVSDPQSI